MIPENQARLGRSARSVIARGLDMTQLISRTRSLLAVVLLGLTVSACGYNTIPTLEEQAKAKWADVQNNYQRRADLIPNLVATVQGYAKQEKDVLTSVVEARAKATQVKIDASQLTDPEKLKQFQDAQNQLSGALGRLLAVSENYPDLKSNQNFLALQSQLEGTENRITVARRDYIEAVRAYNTELRTFPGVLWASTAFRVEQADGGVRRQRHRAVAAPGQVLDPPFGARPDDRAHGTSQRAPRRTRGRRCPCAAAACACGRCGELAGTHRPHRRSGQCHTGRDPRRTRTKARRPRVKVRHPACRRDRQLARRRGDRTLRQHAVPRLEAWRKNQEQRRPLPRRAEGTPRPHRGRVRA